MAHTDKCSLWPFLRLAELHRLNTNYKTGYVFPAVWRPQELHTGELALAARDITERSGVYGELDSLSEAATMQGQGRHIELVGWPQIV